MSVDVKYRTTATAEGGRQGKARSDDGRLEVQLSRPKEIGGSGEAGTNPEQLFAAGYAACFLGAVQGAGHQLKVKISPNATVTATVGIGMRSEGGFGLTVDLNVNLPDLDREDAQKVIEAAHQICPYSNATRNNVDVNLALAG
jgi:Ohr subfamily peroxiredoxin